MISKSPTCRTLKIQHNITVEYRTTFVSWSRNHQFLHSYIQHNITVQYRTISYVMVTKSSFARTHKTASLVKVHTYNTEQHHMPWSRNHHLLRVHTQRNINDEYTYIQYRTMSYVMITKVPLFAPIHTIQSLIKVNLYYTELYRTS